MHQAIVGAGPDEFCIHGRRGDAVDRGIDLGTILIEANGSTGLSEGLRIGEGQIIADAIPGIPRVTTAPQVLRAGVERPFIGR
jgi:hypothetical protein